MLRLSRSHDQNRRRAGETAGKAATLTVQCDVLSGRTGEYCWRTQKWWKRADELPQKRASLAEKVFILTCDWHMHWLMPWANSVSTVSSHLPSIYILHPNTLMSIHDILWAGFVSTDICRLHVLQNLYQSSSNKKQTNQSNKKWKRKKQTLKGSQL